MRLDENLFLSLLSELADENPVAVRTVLRILRTEFTQNVPTLAVTLEERPRLLVNLAFLRKHCRTEAHVKACILHEFLHVLLGHTERFKTMSPAQNLALDAVVNAVIHRTVGSAYSDFFRLYYEQEEGLGRLLRVRTEAEEDRLKRQREADEQEPGTGYSVRNDFELVWDAIYEGKLVADDILDLAKDLENRFRGALDGGTVLIGNHEEIGRELPEALARALDEAMKEMNGGGIWRCPKDRGVGAVSVACEIPREDLELSRWKAQTMRVLKECLAPDPKALLTEGSPLSCRLPVLTPRDRRAFVRSLWSPILPEAEWLSEVERPLGSANVYLDVSGSMNAEMPHVVALLWQLRRMVRTPFWAFSDEVKPARIVDGRLVTESTGGTSMDCVLSHLEKTRPAAAVVFTDGYIEEVSPWRVSALKGVRLRAIVTRNGSPSALERAGIPYRQLGRFPNG